MSDGPRSCNLIDTLYLDFKNKTIYFPTLPSVEEAIENIFMSQCCKHQYQTDNFISEQIEQKIKITLCGESFLFEEEQEIYSLEKKLCSLYNKFFNKNEV